MGKLESVRADRTLSRSGLWATGPRQMTLPVEARGLSEVVCASGSLAISPDYSVLAWLCERWIARPTESGWMRPTLYEIGSDLYDVPPSGKHYQDLRAALSRLATVSLTVRGIDGETGEPHPDAFIQDGLLGWTSRTASLHLGTDRPGIQLAGWLRGVLDRGAPVRLDWRTLRAFDENQKLAARLWVYLSAERWKRFGDGRREGCWIACGDRLEASLGMEYERRRKAREALKRACEAIRHVDARYVAGSLAVVKLGHSWRIQAERPTWEEWRGLRSEHEQARKAISEGLRELRPTPGALVHL
jgi:hypothetical protein